jgi:SAM-dependent methyltransferase
MPRTKRDLSDPEMTYFDLQAYVGATKHMGGLETTKELVELCHIGEDTYVLDVGCGVGATACYLAETLGCRVVGVDLRESMVARSSERAQRLGLTKWVEFRVADAQDLPFDDERFDVVLCESVATFVVDKQQVVNELARVVRPGGHVGLNEEIWLRTPPDDLAAFVKRTWDIEPEILSADDWRALLEHSGLTDVTARRYEFDARREASQVKRYGPGDMLRSVYRTLALYVRNATFRSYMKDRRRLPRNMFEHFGYVILVGKKGG